MYIAIIADDVAARKQYERLFDRSSDALRSTLGALYVETFGAPDTLLVGTPMKYGLFFIDLASESSVHTLTDQLRGMNAQGMVCICSDLVPQGLTDTPNLIYIAQNPNQRAIEMLLKEASVYNESINATEKIEIRTEGKTHYLLPDDIVYIQSQNQYLTIYLSDRTILQASGELKRLYDNTLTHDCFFPFKKDVIINTNHIVKKERHAVTLTHDIRFTLPPFSKNPLL